MNETDQVISPEEGEETNTYIGSPEHIANCKAAQAKSVANRQSPGYHWVSESPKHAANRELTKETAYTRSVQPIAVDDKGKQSVRAEVATYIASKEGVKFLRKSIRTTLIKAAYGDLKSLELILDIDPSVTQVLVQGMIGHLVADAAKGVVSPAERRKLELKNVEHTYIEAEQVPVERDELP